MTAGRAYETTACSYAVVHGVTCCWHMDERAATHVVTLGDERGRCEHYVCLACVHSAVKGDIPEQHSDQSFIAMRIRTAPSASGEERS